MDGPIKNFIISRLGNKTTDIRFFNEYLPDPNTLNVMCEPFAGTFSLIRNVYYDVPVLVCGENDKTFLDNTRFILNHLNKFYQFRNAINEYGENNTLPLKNIHQFFKDYKHDPNVVIYEKFMNILLDTVWDRYKKPLSLIDYGNLKKLYNRIIRYDDYKPIFDKYKNTKNCFMFLDPPYFESDNTGYSLKK